jgi:transcriptional regulator with XRE-family HTH domain
MKEQLKLVRLALKMNQSKIAEVLGIGLKSWQQYESGANTPGGNVLESLHKTLGVNLNWLISSHGEMFHKEGGVAYDRDLLIQAIATLDDCIAKKKMKVDSQKKSKVAVKLYENLKKSGVEAGSFEAIEKEANELLELI